MAMQEPQITQTDPKAYYYWLQSQGMNAYQASELVKQRFPPPEQKTPEQQQREAGRSSQNAALAQTAGMVGGIVAGRYVYNNVSGWIDQATGAKVSGDVVQQAAQQTGQGAATTTAGASGAEGASAQAVTEVGTTTMPDGTPGKLMSDGGKVGENGKIVNPDGSSGGSISGQALAGLQIAGGAAQAYNGYRQYQSGEKIGGAANMAGGAYNAAAGAQALYGGGTAGSLAQYAPAVGTAVAAAQVGQQMVNDKGASEDRAAKSQAEAQKAALLWIPGYGWVAYAALAGLDAVSGGKATEGLMKFNKANNKLTDRIDFGLGKSIRSKLFHQSTKGVQEMHTGQLMQQSDDPQWQGYVAGMRAQVKDGPKDKSKPFAGGKYASWGEYKKAGLQADDLTGVYGNIDAFKPDYAEKAGMPNWSNLNFEQQKAVTQRLIDEDMYSSKKGEVVIADKEKARRIYEEMAKTNFGVPQGASPMAGPQAPQVSRAQAGQVARVSPGMYVNDKGKVTAAKSMRESLEQNYGKSKTKSRRK
jgi:hypothetical protein